MMPTSFCRAATGVTTGAHLLQCDPGLRDQPELGHEMARLMPYEDARDLRISIRLT